MIIAKKKFQSDITRAEAHAILDIRKGADVYDYGLAGTLRGMQRRGLPVFDTTARDGAKRLLRRKPPKLCLFHITTPMMYKGDGADRMPYFGAIATKHGLARAKAVLQ